MFNHDEIVMWSTWQTGKKTDVKQARERAVDFKRLFMRSGVWTIVLAVVLAGGLAGCSSTGEDDQIYVGEIPVHDPFEGVNRAVLSVNEGIDEVLLEPVATGYRKATPKAFRLGLRNFLRNLKSPVVIGNQILQGDLEGTVNATGRLIINTLAGFGGLLDLAEEGGIPYEPEDFGQTLAKWGVGNGPYLVIPLLGPSTARDSFGRLVDSYADPLRIYLFNTDREEWHYARIGADVIDQREQLLDVLDDLRRNSFDYYAALRSAYYQRREALINDQDPELSSAPAIPDYDD